VGVVVGRAATGVIVGSAVHGAAVHATVGVKVGVVV
jgi:hypothetical protein